MLVYLQMIETEEDCDKFTTMYKEYCQNLHGIAMIYLRNYHDAEDAVHQAFMYVAKNMDKVSLPVCARTHGYLAIITKHMAIDMIRKRKTVEFDLDRVPCEETFYDGDPLTNAILKLKPKDQEALILHFKYGYTLKELAKFYNMKYDALQKRMLRAKQTLEQILREDGVEI